MFWSDKLALELKKRKLPLEWVDDAKTPSGRVHVGALRGVVIHDLIFKSLISEKVKSKYTYILEDHDPMDGLPIYLPQEKYEKYMGMPLYKVPSPQPGFENFAKCYGLEFEKVFNEIGCHPEIIWGTSLYLSGKMNSLVKDSLDKAQDIREIYERIYKKEVKSDWYPFQVYCPNCGKVSTTTVNNWNGKEVSFVCEENKVKYAKGCKYQGKVSPLSPNEKGDISGKLTWKVEWPAKWKAIGVTVEWSGKDHMSKGGSFDVASEVSEKVFNYPVPNARSYEHFLFGGKKMSSSKGIGSSAAEMLEILPPEILRFLMVKTRYNQAINFDPSGDTIPKLFDDYQRFSESYINKSNEDEARAFELSQVEEFKIKMPPKIRFSVLAQWIQMPNMEETIKKEGLSEWSKYAKVWVERYAPESEKFVVQEKLPEETRNLSERQKEFLQKISQELYKNWNAEEFQKNLYTLTQDLEIPSKEAFSAIYKSLIGKDHGPKAAWLILSLDKDFVKKRFEEASKLKISSVIKNDQAEKINTLDKPEIFSIDQKLKEKFPSISVGIAIIRGVEITKINKNLEEEKERLLSSLKNLTTEEINEYPEIISYRKLYKETGIDWHSRRPSPEALLRRIALKKGLYSINTCVDAYNLIVLENRVSIGAFDLNKINFPTELRFPKEGEKILLLGDQELTNYKSSEIAYFDQVGGYNIDFNYRDAQRTAVQLITKNLYINVDGVYEITPEKVEEVLRKTCEVIIKYCGGKIELFSIETAS